MKNEPKFKLTIGFWTRDRRGHYAGGEPYWIEAESYHFDSAAEAFEWLAPKAYVERYQLHDPEGNLIHSKGD